MSGSVATFAHIVAMSDGIGTFEHAEHSTRRVDEGYCTDDMARVLVAACREPGADDTAAELARMAYMFLIGAQSSDGMIRNRRAAHGGWSGDFGVEDCWGRAMWAFGTAMRSAPQEWLRDSAQVSFDRGVELRSPWPRAMAFAALGAAEVLAVRPQHAGARRLLSDTVDAIGRPDSDPDWVWPERRLTYANAVLAEATIAAGAFLGRPDVLDDGLAALRWLLTRETVAGHLSPTGTTAPGPATTHRCSTSSRSRPQPWLMRVLAPFRSPEIPTGTMASGSPSAGSSASTTPTHHSGMPNAGHASTA